MEYLPPLKAQIRGCMNCGYTTEKMPLRYRMENYHFDSDSVFHDDKMVFNTFNLKDGKAVRLQRFENHARKLGGDWQLHIDRAMRNAVYQRQGEDNWVLVKVGNGFV